MILLRSLLVRLLLRPPTPIAVRGRLGSSLGAVGLICAHATLKADRSAESNCEASDPWSLIGGVVAPAK